MALLNNDMHKGVFRLIDGELWSIPFDGSMAEGIAKSGDTYDHSEHYKCCHDDLERGFL